MSTAASPEPIQEYHPFLGASLVAATVLAVLGWIAYVILSIVDADQAPDLPDQLVYLTGRVAETMLIVAVILLCTYLLSRTSARNTRTALADLKSDTGEIPKIREALRGAELKIVVDNERGRGDWQHAAIERDQLARVLAEADRGHALRAAVPADEWNEDQFRGYMTGVYDRMRQAGDGPDPVA